MTSYEIVQSTLEHTTPDRVGLTFERGRINDVLIAQPDAPAGYVPTRWVEDSIEYYDDCWGTIWHRKVGGSEKGEVARPVITDWSELAGLSAPTIDVEACAERYRKQFSKDRENRFHMASVWGWVFNDARYLRGMDNYLMDMILHPEELCRLHSIICDFKEGIIHAAGRSGANGIFVGEDMGTQTSLLFSPRLFRQFFKADYSRLWGLAHDYGMAVFMHSCGQNREILPDLIECGVDCFQFDQPATYDFEDLSSLFKTHGIALWSPVDIQSVLPTGDRKTIQAEADRMIRYFDGFLIAKQYPDLPGIGVDPEWDHWAYQVFAAGDGRRPGLS